jgi:co-chaperonin GroES (HSP10)
MLRGKGPGVKTGRCIRSTSRLATVCCSASDLAPDGEELMMMKESDIMGIVEAGAAAAKTS